MARVGGIIQVQVDGVIQQAKGEFSYNLGHPKREPVVGSDGMHGWKETPQPAFVEGEITDRQDLDLGALVDTTGATVTLVLANGKTVLFPNAFYSGEGTGHTDEGNVDFKFNCSRGEEV